MSAIVLIPGILCVVLMFRTSLQRAFADVYLPIFLLIPDYYYWKVAALPPIDLAEAVLLPLGAALVFRELPNWRFSLADLGLAVFCFGSFYSNALAHQQVTSIFSLFNSLLIAAVPYSIGKLLIEQYGARVYIVRRMVFLLFIASVFALYEYRTGKNPFIRVMDHLFPSEHFGWVSQVRWGFHRVAGPFGQSELAGMVLFTGLLLTLWLTFQKEWEPKFTPFPRLWFKKSTIITGMIALTLLGTQARGPWIGCLLALPIAWIGRSRTPRRTGLLVLVLLVVVGGAGYIAATHYLGGATASGEQQTAQYRQHLLDNYIPVVKAGGAWGYGNLFPRRLGQDSIDNEYLFLALTQGIIGLAAFVLIGWDTLVRLTLAAYQAENRQDRSFAFTLLGIFVGILFTISTVYLGNQSFELFFLIAGWAQALSFRRKAVAPAAFQHVFT